MERKNGYLLGLILAFIFSFSIEAQESKPIKVWDLRYGGDSRDTDVSSIRTADGGFLVTASSLSGISGNKQTPNQGNDDWWVLKLDASGAVQWDYNFGGSLEEGFEAGAVETSDGHFVLAGRTRSDISGDIISASYGSNDILVAKIDGGGAGVIWQTRVGGDRDDVAFDVVETSDGGIVVGGYTNSTNLAGNLPMGSLDAYVIKLDGNGILLWQETFGGSGFESADELLATNDGKVLVGGYSASTDLSVPSNGSFDFWLFEVDETGTQTWENLYGGSGLDAVRGMAFSNDGGVLLGGQSDSPADGNKSSVSQGLDDMWMVRTDNTGQILWEKSFGGSGYDWCQSILGLPDGSFVIGGFSNSPISGDKEYESINGSLDAWFLKLDASGDQEWQGLFGGLADDGDVNIPYYDQELDEVYLSGTTNSGLGAYLTTENFGSAGDIWLSKFRVNRVQDAETCPNSSAIISVQNTVEGKSYQLRNGDDSLNGEPVIGNGLAISLISDPVSESTAIEVYATSTLPDATELVEFVGTADVNLANTLGDAINTSISYPSEVCYGRSAKVWIDASVAGLEYELIDLETGDSYGDRTGNGAKIQIRTPKLKESIILSLRISNESCEVYHSEEIDITVLDKIDVAIEFDPETAIAGEVMEFNAETNGTAESWTWIFDRRTRVRGQSVEHTFSRPGYHFVTLRVRNQTGCKREVSCWIYVKDDTFISAPGIFRPQRDDPFKVLLKNVKKEELRIFNNQGRPVYSGKNSWNGRKRGGFVRQGLYVYYIRAKRHDGTLFQKRGSFYVKY